MEITISSMWFRISTPSTRSARLRAALREMADVHPSVLVTDLLVNDAVSTGRHHDVSGVFTDKREDKLRIKAPSNQRMKPKKRLKK